MTIEQMIAIASLSKCRSRSQLNKKHGHCSMAVRAEHSRERGKSQVELLDRLPRRTLHRLRWQNNTISSIAIVTDNTPTESKTSTASTEPSFGWNVYAELVNGRFAMVGFLVLLGLEFFTGQDLWTWLGLR
jgi:hypothetical protein